MAILEKYRVEGEASKRYVRKHSCQDFYEWCEQSKSQPWYDVAQGTCLADDLPKKVREKCDATESNGFYACEWPFDS